jgi:hypothetical protein
VEAEPEERVPREDVEGHERGAPPQRQQRLVAAVRSEERLGDDQREEVLAAGHGPAGIEEERSQERQKPPRVVHQVIQGSVERHQDEFRDDRHEFQPRQRKSDR